MTYFMKNMHIVTLKKISPYFFLTTLIFALQGGIVFSHLNLEEVAIASQDEFTFKHFSEELLALIKEGEIRKVLDFGPHYAYGFLFWFFSAVLVYLFSFLGDAALFSIFRALSLMLLSGALFFIYKTLRIYQTKNISLLATLSILGFPMFHFFGKIYSVEYVITFLSCYCVYNFFKSHDYDRPYFIGLFSIGLAVGFKLNAATLLVFPALYVIKFRLKNHYKVICKSFSIVALGFFIVNPVLLFSSKAWYVLFSYIPSSTHLTIPQRIEMWFSGNYFHYYEAFPLLGIKYSVGIMTLLACTFLIFITGYNGFRLKKKFEALSIPIFVFSNIFIVSTKSDHLFYWYLFPAFILMPLVFMFNNKANPILISIFILSMIPNYENIKNQYYTKQYVYEFLDYKYSSSERLIEYINQVPDKTRILTTLRVLVGDENRKRLNLNQLAVPANVEKKLTKFPDTQYILVEKPIMKFKELYVNYRLPDDFFSEQVEISEMVFENVLETETDIVLKKRT